MEAAWVLFRDLVGTLPLGRFEEPTSAGWTLKQMVAHVAAWEETVPPRLASVGAGGPDAGYDDIDGFNARVRAEVKGVAPVAVIRRLDAAHAALLAAVAELPGSGRLDPLAADIVRWNTTLHYPDHHGELSAARPLGLEAERGLDGW